MKKNRGILLAAVLVLGAAVLPVKGVLAAQDSSETISSGVYIGDVNVSGMTEDEARQAVEEGMSAIRSTSITLKVDDATAVVNAGEFGLSWKNTDVVEEALGLGKSGNIIKRYKDKKDLENESKRYTMEYSTDKDAIKKVIQAKADVFNREPTDAEISTDSGVFEVIRGENGIEVNVDKSVKKIYKYIIITTLYTQVYRVVYSYQLFIPFLNKLRKYIIYISYDAVISGFKYRSLRVLVDCNDNR